jgi:hypothetical protein
MGGSTPACETHSLRHNSGTAGRALVPDPAAGILGVIAMGPSGSDLTRAALKIPCNDHNGFA